MGNQFSVTKNNSAKLFFLFKARQCLFGPRLATSPSGKGHPKIGPVTYQTNHFHNGKYNILTRKYQSCKTNTQHGL